MLYERQGDTSHIAEQDLQLFCPTQYSPLHQPDQLISLSSGPCLGNSTVKQHKTSPAVGEQIHTRTSPSL